MSSLSRALATAALAVAILEPPGLAQTGPYPPQTYPPGTYPPQTYPPGSYPPQTYPDNRVPARIPGGGTIGIPVPEIKLPRRGSKDKDKEKAETSPAKAPAPQVTLRAVTGKLRVLGDKELILESEKHGLLRFRVLAKTQFRDPKGEPMRDSLLKPGDAISVRFNAIDEETILFVYLVRAGTAAERAAGAKPVDAAAVKTPENLEAEEVATPVVEAAARVEPTAPGEAPPVIRRRTVDDDYSDTVMPKSDEVIQAAREQADGINQSLPNFLVQQQTTRYMGRPGAWQARDLVTAEVAYVNGTEEYRNVRVNGRPVDAPQDSGSWSTGEFATTLQDVMSPATGAAFSRRTDQLSGTRTLLVYDFVVPRARSHWTLITPSRESYRPAYKGTVWIDKETKHVMRIEKHSLGLPDDFPYDQATWIVEYDAVRVDGGAHMLPIRAENHCCERSSGQCTRNEIFYRNYRKFGAESEIKYDKFLSTVD